MLLLLGSCTYSAPEPLIRIEHHARRAGTDSFVVAMSVARIRRPTGLAAFPDGGSPKLDDQHGLFFLCVGSSASSASRRIASIARPDSLRTQFVPWVTTWDGPESVIASVSGYVGAESAPKDFRRLWFRLHLTGAVSPLAGPVQPTDPASSLPPSCESRALADAKRFLAERAR